MGWGWYGCTMWGGAGMGVQCGVGLVWVHSAGGGAGMGAQCGGGAGMGAQCGSGAGKVGMGVGVVLEGINMVCNNFVHMWNISNN